LRTRLFAAAALAVAFAAPLHAQGLMGDMHRDLNEVQKKFIDLANAIPESAYAWKPNGARSLGQVVMHVASDNYWMPVAMGKPAPEATGVKADYNTAVAYENRKLSKAEMIAELTASFRHLHQSIPATDAGLDENIKMFGQDFTRRRAVVVTVTHLHEHLGQLIAYARANNVTPPWSK
jgi:uncharacterized damage-inducible protein DinB